jgi:hypothetical protein
MTGAIRTVQEDALDAVAAGHADDPFAVLGPHASTHKGRPALVIRTMQPSASAVELVTADRVIAMGCSRRRSMRAALLSARWPTASASTKREKPARWSILTGSGRC